ncbi:MAG TPA: BMP family ABC transporter substrate-binding protein [Bacillota bacterium]|nr:BMP family ABC transporter substrate-binding protein [Bacillota bacterium]
MKKTRVLFLVLSLVLVLALSTTGMAAVKFRAAMVTDIGGLGDKSFNDAAYDGLKKLQKELGAEIKVIESKKMEDYVPNLKSLADQKYDIIWAVGFLMKGSMEEVAKMYPNQKFGMVDDVISLPNVTSVTFKEEEGSFLVGVIAGTDTKKKAVGFVGGMDFPLIQKFEAGFKAGVKAANPKLTIRSAYAGAFDNPSKGKELATAQFTFGADIVYHAAGATGLGVINAAKEKGKGYWAIGVDKCQHAEGVSGNKNSVLTCMIKRVDVGIYKVSADAAKGNFKGTQIQLGLAEDGVGYCANSKKTASAKAIKAAEAFKAKIIAGKIKVPTDPKAVK